MVTEKPLFDIGKKVSALQSGQMCVRKYEKGLMIKRKGQEWLTLDEGDADSLALHIRDFSKYCRLFTEKMVWDLLKLAGIEEIREHIEKYDAMTYEELRDL